MNTETNLQLVLDTASTLTEVEFPYALAFSEWATKYRTEHYSVKGEDGESLYNSLHSGLHRMGGQMQDRAILRKRGRRGNFVQVPAVR